MSRSFPWKFDENHIEQPEYYEWFVISYLGMDIGTIWIEKEKNIKESGRLGVLIGDNNYWNKGIGTIAIEKAIEISKEKLKIKTIYINVRTNNPRAISCYKKCGFKKMSEGEKIKNSEKTKFIAMKKEL